MVSTKRSILAGGLLLFGMSFSASSQVSAPLKSATWWNPAESGWGLFTIDQGNVLAPGWFTYDEDGEPTWFLVPGALPQADGTYTGEIVRFTGVPFDRIAGAAADPGVNVGNAELRFEGDKRLTFTTHMSGATVSRQLERFPFGTQDIVCRASDAPLAVATNYSDLWWAPESSGWGVHMSHVGESLFATWYTYDADRESVFLVGATARQADGSFLGPLLRQRDGIPYGQIDGAPPSPGADAVGSVALRFLDGERAEFTYTLGDVTQTKPLTRFRFGDTVAACSVELYEAPPSNPESSALEVVAGLHNTCVLSAAGGVKCWGWNFDGEVGDGTTEPRRTPVGVVGLESEQKAVAIGCAAANDGAMQCWGPGPVGNGLPSRTLVPVPIAGIPEGVRQISSGLLHRCALSNTGRVLCWGANGQGQLGDGSAEMKLVPTEVLGLGGEATAVAAGDLHTCALMVAGNVRCWGWNGYGELGDGTDEQREVPVDVGGLEVPLVAIGAGGSFNCGLSAGGAVLCWGKNTSGQLGSGTMDIMRTNPGIVANLEAGVQSISVGDGHACAVTLNHDVLCWGINITGQLGEENLFARAVPGLVRGLEGQARSVAAGRGHSCAITLSGAVKCWGSNVNGVLGDGSTTRRLEPVTVVGFEGGP